MRKLKFFAAFFILPFSFSFAQYDTLIGSPPGYTIPQLRSVKDITTDQAGNVWLAFSSIGLVKYDGASFTVYDSLNSGLLNNKILSVAVNTAGIWAGSDTGLYIFDGSNWTRMTVANAGLYSDSVPKLYSPGGTEMYTINISGFSYYNGSTWQHYNSGNSGLIDDGVQCLYKDASGILWAGTKNGLSGFDGSTWQNFTTANSELQDNDIISLTEDGNQNLFISTAHKGIYFYDGITHVHIADSLNSYYTFPWYGGKLFRLQNGSVLQSPLYNESIYSTNPIHVLKMQNSFGASDTNYVATVDANNHIWKITKRSAPYGLWMRDSLEYYPQQSPLANYYDLDVNQVRCGMVNSNSFHWDMIGTAKYEVPKGGMKNSVFASDLWIGGLDPMGNLHMAAHTYRQSGNDFWPGPLDTIYATVDSSTVVQYDSIWKINKALVYEFILQYDSGNVSNGSYIVPDIIMNWPAHGSGNYSYNLAPFIDRNADGVYNPMDGDYPDIKGDQMLWWVMNDNYQNHGETDGIPFGLEIRSSAYAYYCSTIADSNEVVNYTTFYSFDIINRSDTDYHDVYVGMYVDVDLGNYLDDYVGCNIENDFGFAYNGDNDDEGIAGYGLNPPMQSIAMLKGPLAEPNDGIDNDHNGITDEPGETCMLNHFMYHNNDNDPISGNPSDAGDYYDYLRAIWRNGNHLTYGGNGYGGGFGGTADSTDYMYPGTPYDTGWTETAAGNLPSDRRMILSSGPFNLSAGEKISIDYAYIFTRDESAPNGLNTSVSKNLADVKKIRHWFDTDSFPCNNSSVGIPDLKKEEVEFSIYPNPASESLTVNRSTLTGTANLELYDIMGQKINSYSFPSGKSEIKIRTGNLPAGIYFLELQCGNNFAAKKLIIE